MRSRPSVLLLLCALASTSACFFEPNPYLPLASNEGSSSTGLDAADDSVTSSIGASPSQTGTDGSDLDPMLGETSAGTTGSMPATSGDGSSAGDETSTGAEPGDSSESTGTDASTGDAASTSTADSCGECMPPFDCMDSGALCGLTFGWPAELGDPVTIGADVIFGHPIQLPADATLAELSFLSGQLAGQGRMGLYTDDGMGPAELVAVTAPGAIVAGVNSFDSFDILQDPLPAGDYWIMLQLSIDTLVHRSPPGDDDHPLAFMLRDYALGFPQVMGEEFINNDYQHNLFGLAVQG